MSDSSHGKPGTIEMYGPGNRSTNDMSSRIETVSSLQSEKSVRFSTSDDNRNHIVRLLFQDIYLLPMLYFLLLIDDVEMSLC